MLIIFILLFTTVIKLPVIVSGPIKLYFSNSPIMIYAPEEGLVQTHCTPKDTVFIGDTIATFLSSGTIITSLIEGEYVNSFIGVKHISKGTPICTISPSDLGRPYAVMDVKSEDIMKIGVYQNVWMDFAGLRFSGKIVNVINYPDETYSNYSVLVSEIEPSDRIPKIYGLEGAGKIMTDNLSLAKMLKL